MNQTILWLILLQPVLENKVETRSRELKNCMQKPAVTAELKKCSDKQQSIKGYQQAILNSPNCSFKQPLRTVCA